MTKPWLRKGTSLFSWPLCGYVSGVKTQEVNMNSSACAVMSGKALLSCVDLSKKFVLATAHGWKAAPRQTCGRE